MKYQKEYERSIQHPEEFWKKQAELIDWYQEPSSILSKDSNDYYQWFSDGKLNLSYLCVDKHVKDGFGHQNAIIYDSPVTNTVQHITYLELYDQVARLAGGLKELGLEQGDTCIIYMPMIPQAIFSMLACARIGVIHSVVFGGFAPHELAIRIDDCKPKVIITASNGIEINKLIPYKPFVDEAIQQANHKPEHTIVYNRNLGVDVPYTKNNIDFTTMLQRAEKLSAVPVPANHPSYILYTSGTTGQPKASEI